MAVMDKTGGPVTSIVIPAKDEARSIASVILAARESMAGKPHEIIVVDDGSSDNTGQIAAKNGVVLLSHPKNLGKGASMKDGASKATGDIIVFIDADGAHDAADIPDVIAPIVDGQAEFVIGSRALPDSRVPTSPFLRKTVSNLASFTTTVLISQLLPLYTLYKVPPKWIRITDVTSGFRAITADGWRKLNIKSDGFEIETEMIYEAAKYKLSITEAAISCNWNPALSRLSVARDGLATFKLLLGKFAHDVGGRRLSRGA